MIEACGDTARYLKPYQLVGSSCDGMGTEALALLAGFRDGVGTTTRAPAIDMRARARRVPPPPKQVGINFLMLLYRSKVSGAILADEMGLGKTAQLITYLGAQLRAGPSWVWLAPRPAWPLSSPSLLTRDLQPTHSFARRLHPPPGEGPWSPPGGGARLAAGELAARAAPLVPRPQGGGLLRQAPCRGAKAPKRPQVVVGKMGGGGGGGRAAAARGAPARGRAGRPAAHARACVCAVVGTKGVCTRVVDGVPPRQTFEGRATAARHTSPAACAHPPALPALPGSAWARGRRLRTTCLTWATQTCWLSWRRATSWLRRQQRQRRTSTTTTRMARASCTSRVGAWVCWCW
jgi:hypothetical protein